MLRKLSGLKNIEKIEVSLTLITIALMVPALPLTYFGYKLNESIEERNKAEWKIEQANYVRNFWSQMEENELDAIQRIERIGKATGEAQVAYMNFVSEFGKLYESGMKFSEIKKTIAMQKQLLNLVGKFQAVKNEVNLVSIKYDNSLLIYSGLAETMGIIGWKQYASHQKDFVEWSNGLSSHYNGIIVWLNQVINQDELSVNFEKELFDKSTEFALGMKFIGNPGLKAIHELKKNNRVTSEIQVPKGS